MNSKAAIGAVALVLLGIGLPAFLPLNWAWGAIVTFAGLTLLIISCRDWLFGAQSTSLGLNQLAPHPQINAALLRTARSMVTDVHSQMRTRANKRTAKELLELHRDFPTIRPYLSERSRTAIYGRTSVVAPSQSTMDGTLHSILEDIDLMEQERGLR